MKNLNNGWRVVNSMVEYKISKSREIGEDNRHVSPYRYFARLDDRDGYDCDSLENLAHSTAFAALHAGLPINDIEFIFSKERRACYERHYTGTFFLTDELTDNEVIQFLRGFQAYYKSKEITIPLE
ncbi:hypothetical protein J4456_03475 [Candidatus Pacearchaeota archaeon]|nr:hypothetical protein [Candidatus Pacearchaeota archaeon]